MFCAAAGDAASVTQEKAAKRAVLIAGNRRIVQLHNATLGIYNNIGALAGLEAEVAQHVDDHFLPRVEADDDGRGRHVAVDLHLVAPRGPRGAA